MTQGLEGLPIVKPPYGVMAAIDVNKGSMLWRVPHGDASDAVRATLTRLGLNVTEKLGQQSVHVGVLITKSIVVAGDSSVTTTPQHPRGALLRAYDKQTGKQVGGVLMDSAQSGSPMTYMIDGRQYIVVACSGGGSGEYVAFALPPSEIRPATANKQ